VRAEVLGLGGGELTARDGGGATKGLEGRSSRGLDRRRPGWEEAAAGDGITEEKKKTTRV
jgi:hypothetical protein